MGTPGARRLDSARVHTRAPGVLEIGAEMPSCLLCKMESKDRILCGLNLLLLNSHYDILVPPLAAVMVPCVCRPEGPVHSHCAPLIP